MRLGVLRMPICVEVVTIFFHIGLVQNEKACLLIYLFFDYLFFSSFNLRTGDIGCCAFGIWKFWLISSFLGICWRCLQLENGGDGGGVVFRDLDVTWGRNKVCLALTCP